MKIPATVSTSHLNHTPPTARELLHDILSPSADGPWVSASSELATRVEKVLALVRRLKNEGPYGIVSCDAIERILNGFCFDDSTAGSRPSAPLRKRC